MTVRPLRRRDLPIALTLWEALMDNGHRADARWVPAVDARERIRSWAEGTWLQTRPFPHAWLAEVDGVGAGFIAGFPVAALPVLEGPQLARIGDLWVQPTYRRRGLGKALVDAFTGAAAAAGYGDVEVGTLTADGRAVAFWRAMGFGDWKITLRR